MNGQMTRTFYWGVLTALVVAAFPDLSLAAVVGDSIEAFRTSDVKEVPVTINAIAFVAGAALGVSGALKLKEHAENPAQVRAAVGIGRLLAGGALAGLPYLVQTALDTLHMSGQVTFTAISLSTT